MAHCDPRSLDEQIPTLLRPDPETGEPDLTSILADLRSRLDGGGNLMVVVNDPQRHTDTARVLRVLAELDRRAGAPRRFGVLVACGTHGFGRQRRLIFQRDLSDAADIASIDWHDCRDADLQTLDGDHRWRANPLLTAGDGPVLAIGSVEPHYFAGLTGAHKTLTIGCAAHADIEANHAGAMSAEAAPFALEGNPVFEGVRAMLDGLRRRRPVWAVNLVQTGPEILAAAAGDPLATLDELAPCVERLCCRTLATPAAALVLEVVGPLAGSFYQADKAIKNSEAAVADGGVLVLVAACPDGVGQDHFLSLLRQGPTHAAAMGVVADRGYRLGDHKAVRLRRLTDGACRGVRVVAVSDGLDETACELLGMTKAASVSEALASCGVDRGSDTVYRVPDAGNTVVRVDTRRRD